MYGISKEDYITKIQFRKLLKAKLFKCSYFKNWEKCINLSKFVRKKII